jgi:hypothetical protein
MSLPCTGNELPDIASVDCTDIALRAYVRTLLCCLLPIPYSLLPFHLILLS